MARVALGESKMRTRRRRRRLLAVGIAVLLLGFLFAALAFVSQASFLRVSTITVSGTQTLATSTIADFVRQQMEGEYLYFFPKNNILLYPKERIISSLLSSMPALASVSISADTFSAISVNVIEREPKALWCGNTPQDPVPCFLLDESGVAYAGDVNFSDNAYKDYFGYLTGSTTPKQYLTPSSFRSLSALVDTVAVTQRDGRILSAWVDGNNDVHAMFASGFTLLFALSSDGGDIYQRFTLALSSDPFKQHKLSDFEYLDLRFGDKLYYKLK